MKHEIWIPGTPRPQGSMKLARDPRTGREFARYSKPTYEWRQTQYVALVNWWGDRPPLTGPVAVNLTYLMPRPKSHWSARGGLKPSAPVWHTVTPDNDKLIRNTLDSMSSAGVWRDDSQCALLRSMKTYTDTDGKPGVLIVVEPL